jgi:hypothetical protein
MQSSWNLKLLRSRVDHILDSFRWVRGNSLSSWVAFDPLFKRALNSATKSTTPLFGFEMFKQPITIREQSWYFCTMYFVLIMYLTVLMNFGPENLISYSLSSVSICLWNRQGTSWWQFPFLALPNAILNGMEMRELTLNPGTLLQPSYKFKCSCWLRRVVLKSLGTMSDQNSLPRSSKTFSLCVAVTDNYNETKVSESAQVLCSYISMARVKGKNLSRSYPGYA